VGEGLQLVFDPALDGPGWPGPLRDRDAAFGEAWVGPLGLLDRLEVELGLRARHASPTERAAALVPALARADGFWAASFAADPLATSARLLGDRDLLALWGWRGEAAGARLEALWRVTADALPGVPDRLRRVLARLSSRRVDIARIRLVDHVAYLPPLWQQVLAALPVEVTPLVTAGATGDLAAARDAGFAPVGDGTLQLVQAHGPLAAADEVAAALAGGAALDDVVIVGADAVLDGALARLGLPRVGAAVDAPGSTGLVRLVLEAAFQPMDPADLHALLCADPGPVPRRIGRRLARVISSLPGRGSTGWREALADGLATLEDDRRAAVAARLTALLEPSCARDEALPLPQLVARLGALTTWARGRVATESSLADVITFADRVVALARRTGLDGFPRPTLRRLCDEVARASTAGPVAEHGLAGVVEPGAILAPARCVVWWNFTRGQAPRAPRLRLSRAERDALAAAGITAPDPGAVMAGEARRWRRPVQQATGALVLVCPHTDAAGEAAHPHPLWDELVALMPEPARAARLVRPAMSLPATARRVAVALRPRLAARDRAQAPRALALREVESPSSLEVLLGCSLAWALRHAGWVRGGFGTGPGEPGPLLFGNLAHHVLAEVFADGALDAEAAAARAAAVFERELPALAEQLLLPEHQVDRSLARRSVVETARELGRVLARTGATVRGVEHEVEGTLGGAAVKGRADLLLDGPDVVIDFKWGASGYRERMQDGIAVQLAMYAGMARRDGASVPGVAYLSLSKQRFFAARGTALGDVRAVGEHSADDMLRGVEAGIAARVGELAAGLLVAPAALEDVEDEGLAGGRVRLAPKCDYCELATLCGKRGRP